MEITEKELTEKELLMSPAELLDDPDLEYPFRKEDDLDSDDN